MDTDIIKDFCISEDSYLLFNLTDEAHQFTLAAAEYCLTKNLGRLDLARSITDTFMEWEYTVTPINTLLFRGTNKIPTEKDRATYYATDIDTANQYIPATKTGYMNVYKVKKNMRLFKLDSIYNANKLLKLSFNDKTLVIPAKKMKKGFILPGRTLYDIIRQIYTGDLFLPQKETEAHQITRLRRDSDTRNDLIFSNWLCNQGFAGGYQADEMKQKKGHTFPSELMICKPTEYVQIIDNIEMKKTKNKNVLTKIVAKYS